MFSKKVIVATVLSGILCGTAISMPKQQAEAGIYVTDLQNIAQNTQTALNTAANAVNTAKQVALAVQNLASMDSKALVAHYLNIDKQYKKAIDYLDEQVGALGTNTSKDQVLDEMGAGGSLYYNGMQLDELKNNVKRLYHIEDDTYASALEVGRKQQQIEEGMQNLEQSLSNLNHAQGQKEALQAQGQIQSQGVLENSKTNNMLAVLAGVIAVKNLGENSQKQAEIKRKEAMVTDTQTGAQKAIDEIEANSDQNAAVYQAIVEGRY